MTYTERNRPVIEEFRAGEGKVGGYFAGTPLLLLTTTGHRSGTPRTSPLAYREDDHGRPIVFATNAGSEHDPAWYANLLANPRVTVEIGASTYTATAIPADDEERDRLHRHMVETSEAYAGYTERTSRTFPAVVLHRVDEDRERALGDELTRIHDSLRTALADLLDQAAMGGTPAPQHLLDRLRTHCVTVCGDLESHHGKEEHLFPRLEKQFPALAPMLDDLRRQHAVLEKQRAEIESLCARTDLDPEERRAELARLTEKIEAHFVEEERRLCPVLDILDPALLGRPN
ncbi:nitroreductase/quinone reductase family protein [Actinomadura rupiterrae]|uniref:nitroreductase/quinone reductase family protein n=1 Tax=Actinomadura rupiterrae TaxID=559627 RepID=UPI0020A3EE45|nr:nitroreductase/quinone reductase family protein [Actinomadura rupiterrae]MCP2343026.1 deazaflavin-dependent oxidoreductase (nitroreductase family) [Actinomadura rupiterrae]